MKLQLRLFILVSLISICLNARTFETDINNLSIISCNAITSLDDSKTLVSGNEVDYIPFIAQVGAPALQLSTVEGEFLDTLSYPQFSFMTILQSRNDGRVLDIASDTINERYFFITIGNELSDIKLNRFLAINADFNITKINEATLENNQVVLDAIINKNQESIRALLYYEAGDLRLTSSVDLPDVSGTYHRLSNGTNYYFHNRHNQPVVAKKYDADCLFPLLTFQVNNTFAVQPKCPIRLSIISTP